MACGNDAAVAAIRPCAGRSGLALQALDVIAGVTTEPCGGIRRINVEIPPLSVSDMRRLKATDKVGQRPLCVQHTACTGP